MTTQTALLNTAQAAAYTGFALHTMRVWRSRGIGPDYVKLGRAVRYRISDLDAWITAGHTKPTAA
ncbi:helix-turn-helix domain-containing protein [Rhodococcus sp. CX]|uniref:helix-turn-helix transcriptional regulator n=1 Tax=Rhodococcus sp. CX TaxID=2789880 RepID=UPI0018CEBBB9|nr:helix-turn-helix domain-containing protein [Rhodococcus sp. CX]MBH0121594.1 helix-turn-helix domain-containing protein [Rhodococcus sp. CX]